MNKYQLIIKIPFEAMDDIEARNKEREMVKTISFENKEVKLQEIYENKIPRGIAL